jgi:hypothetical protein
VAAFHGIAKILDTVYDTENTSNTTATTTSSSSSPAVTARPDTTTTTTATSMDAKAASIAQEQLFDSIGSQYGRQPMEVIMQYISTVLSPQSAQSRHRLEFIFLSD